MRASLLVVTLLVAGCHATAPATAGVDPAGDADGGALTCSERLRAGALCAAALAQRCQSQASDCEATCETRGELPANTARHPSDRASFESAGCRDRCRVGLDGCLRAVQPLCPHDCPE